MIRFPRYNEQEEELETQGDSWTKVYTETWISEKTKSAMFKDDMLPLLKNKRKLLPYLPC